MSLDSIVDDIAAALAVMLPELKVMEPIGGKVSLEQVQDMSRTLPAGFIACMGTRDGELLGNKFRTRGLFLLSLVVKSEAGASKDKLRLITRLVGKALNKIAFAKDWGSAEVDGRPQRISSLNPYTQGSHRENISTWGITWEQDLSLGDPGEVVLDDFLYMDEKIQIEPSNPEIDAEEYVVVQEP